MTAAIDRIIGPGEKILCRRYNQKSIFDGLRHYWELRARNDAAWSCLHAQTVRWAYRLARDNFEEIMQETDIEMLNKLDSGAFVFQNKPPKKYYMTLIFNKFQNFVRSRNKRRTEAIEDAIKGNGLLVEEVNNNEYWTRLEYGLLQLPPLGRALIIIHKILEVKDESLHEMIRAFVAGASANLDTLLEEIQSNVIHQKILFSSEDISLIRDKLLAFADTSVTNIRVRRIAYTVKLITIIQNHRIQF